jgi:hypothetical protein
MGFITKTVVLFVVVVVLIWYFFLRTPAKANPAPPSSTPSVPPQSSKPSVDPVPVYTMKAVDLGDNTLPTWGVNPVFNNVFPRARWIWGSAKANELAPPGIKYEFRTSFTVDTACAATIHVIADNSASVVLNGIQITTENIGGGWGPHPHPRFSVTLKAGTNVLLITAVNLGVGDNPAGLLAGVVRDDTGTVLAQTDSNWSVRTV